MTTLKGRVKEFELRYRPNGEAVANARLIDESGATHRLVIWGCDAEKMARSEIISYNPKHDVPVVTLHGYFKDRSWKVGSEMSSVREFTVKRVQL